MTHELNISYIKFERVGVHTIHTFAQLTYEFGISYHAHMNFTFLLNYTYILIESYIHSYRLHNTRHLLEHILRLLLELLLC